MGAVTGTGTPFPVSFREGVEALLPHTVHMPEGMSEVHPFLRPIVSYRAVKALTNARKGLLQKSNQIVGADCSLFGGKLKLAVQGSQIIANCIHRGII